jgi:hypothetical protein
MVTKELARASQDLLVRSRHQLATSRVALASSLFATTWRRRIGGASDANGAEPQRCHHADTLHLQGHGSYNETRRERDAFAQEFPDRLVSPVVRAKSGVWEWTFCARCVSDGTKRQRDDDGAEAER